jgi:hypothetical protein
VNQKLTNDELTQACRELLSKRPGLSCRRLRILLRERFGCSCRTERIYALWRSIRTEIDQHLSERAEPSTVEEELTRNRQQIATLETALVDAEKRALRAEERERVHQERWAREVYDLRQQLTAANAALKRFGV